MLDSTYNDAPFHAALDQAMALRPDDPEARFWKARLLADGRPVIRDEDVEVDVDTAQMLAHAERAVALDPRNVRYREFLAVTLTEMGRYAEAAAVIREVEGGKHPLHRILRDLDAFPIPGGAVPWPEGGAVLFAVGLDENPPRFAAQTGRSWALTLSKDDVEAFYRGRWPEFELFERGMGPDGDEPTFWFQYFELDPNGKLQPAPDPGFIERLGNAETFEGLLLAVRRAGPGVDGPGWKYPPALTGVEVFSEIIIVSGRK